MELVKKERKIGIVIHNKASLFSNGITQNAYFIHQCLEKAGFVCQFLCHEEDPVSFEYKNISVAQLSLNPLIFDPSEYHTILTITRGLTKELYALLKEHKIRVVGFVCGNTYMHDQEDFIRGPAGNTSTFIGKGSPVDELWVIPSYAHSLEYVEIIRGKPAFIVPHLWSPELLIENFKRNFKHAPDLLHYNIYKHVSPKINIIIMEPNLALFKTAWLPIVASEKLHITHPSAIENVYAFNYPEHNHAYTMADNLTLGQKLRKFKRLSIAEVMYHFNNEQSGFPVFVSHQVLNSLNYLYYELLYFGFPLVHNSPDLEDCGYYYPENNISKCVEQILYAQKHHNKNVKQYKEKALKYLERVDPLHPSIVNTWEQFMNDALSRGVLNSVQ